MGITKDISIGKGKWIKWIELNAKTDSSFEIDYLLEPIREFWKGLETECLSECCGINAYSFWREEVILSAQKLKNEELISNFNKAINELEVLSDEILTSNILNQLIYRKVFIQILKHLRQEIKEYNKD